MSRQHSREPHLATRSGSGAPIQRSLEPGKRTLTSELVPAPAPTAAASAPGAVIQRQAMPGPSTGADRGTLDAVFGRPQPAATTPAEGAGGGGAPLHPATSARMGAAFGTDFSAVRVHESDQPAAMGAVAYAQGNDLHFSPGAYQPATAAGDELIGHELTHVVQQRAGRVQPMAKGSPVNSDPALEAEADVLGAQAARGQAVSVAGHASSAQAQLQRYKPGERMPFTHNGKAMSGLVIRIRTDDKSDDAVVYEVDANMEGDQQSLVVSGGKVQQIEAPPMPKVDAEVDRILDMGIRVAKGEEKEKRLGINEGDLLIGSSIVVKKPTVQVLDSPAYAKAKTGFLRDVVRDLVIISQTRSGRSLLTSIESAAAESGKRVYIDIVDGHISRSNAGQMGSGGEWNSRAQEPGEAANVGLGYNPSVLGLPIAEGNGDPRMVALQDELVGPALTDEWGRPKNKPGDVTLFHELVHGDDILHGRLYPKEVPSGQFDSSKVSEMHAVGLEEYRDDDFLSGKSENPTIYSENTYRHERGVAQRGWYKDPTEMLPAPPKEALGKDDAEQPLLDVPRPLGMLHRSKTKKKRRDDIDSAKQENLKRTTNNERVKRLKDQQNADENRAALLEHTRDTNLEAQKHARLDELGKGGSGAKSKDGSSDKAKDGSSKPSGSGGKSSKEGAEPGAPAQIAGKNVVNVDGSGMNCLINALLTAVGMHTPMRVAQAREFLVGRGVAEHNRMLDLAGEAGGVLIAYLRSKHLLDGDRGVRVHYYQGGALVHQDVAPGGNPVQIFLSFRERHFYAVVD